MDYRVYQLRFIADNYQELRCYAEDGGRSMWSIMTGEPGLTDDTWESVVRSLADFDTALKAIGGRYEINEDGQFLIKGRDYHKMKLYLSGEQ